MSTDTAAIKAALFRLGLGRKSPGRNIRERHIRFAVRAEPSRAVRGILWIELGTEPAHGVHRYGGSLVDHIASRLCCRTGARETA
jgi:hypothetical protein